MIKHPYKYFGNRLKSIRINAKQSLLEVAGAVEIDEEFLKDIESGKKLPDEDILALLMTHFNIKDEEAVKLWEMAGFGGPDIKANLEDQLAKQLMMVISIDNRIPYSDDIKIESNDKGVVLSFLQTLGNGQPIVASKVGMSKDQAKELAKQLIMQVVLGNKPTANNLLSMPKKNKN